MKTTINLVLSLSIFGLAGAHGAEERGDLDWSQENQRRVAIYLNSLSPSDLGRELAGVKSTDGHDVFASGKYLGTVDFGAGVHAYRLAVNSRGSEFDVHYVWVDDGHDRFDATRISCEGTWIEPGGFSSLAGEQWTSHFVEPGGEMLETWCLAKEQRP